MHDDVVFAIVKNFFKSAKINKKRDILSFWKGQLE